MDSVGINYSLLETCKHFEYLKVHPTLKCNMCLELCHQSIVLQVYQSYSIHTPH